MFLFVNFNYVNAEDVGIPEWVLIVYDFWNDDLISDEEFESMLTYLENRGMIEFVLHNESNSLMNFLLNIPQNETLEQFTSCTDGWYVTGYFVPVESDYSDELITISIDETQREFREDFVNALKIEGWGKTLSGDYLGWYGNSFHINDVALDQNGQPLVTGMIAVDNTLIDRGTKLTISTLPQPWNEIIFLSADEGPAIIGKHIDMFTGEGKLAETETFRITSENNTVCK
ncbi:hypothetical protein JYT57_01375 [Nitrosarchaeum koreense]|nr:hypothetical protein [Nitrosarchaeum koreense]